MPPTYQQKQDDTTTVDIHELLRRPSHHHFNYGVQEHHRNSSILQLPSTPADFGEASSFQEEVDHVLIFLTTFLPILLGLSVIGVVALLVRKMRRSESVEEVSPGDTSLGDRSFSSLPVPTGAQRPWWRETTLSADPKVNHSISLPHLLVVDGKHSLSLPHLLAIETYYNYPSAASILDETFHDVVDQTKIQAEVDLGKSPVTTKPPRRPRSLKRTLSLKSLRRLRSRILQLLTFRKQRRERTTTPQVTPPTFNLYELPMETRQQLKQIYVY